MEKLYTFSLALLVLPILAWMLAALKNYWWIGIAVLASSPANCLRDMP